MGGLLVLEKHAQAGTLDPAAGIILFIGLLLCVGLVAYILAGALLDRWWP